MLSRHLRRQANRLVNQKKRDKPMKPKHKNILILALCVIIVLIVIPKPVVEGNFVNVTVSCKKLLAGSTSDQNIELYTLTGTYIETVTTSSGIATLSEMHRGGEVILAQARQADPATADPYIMDTVTFTVPHSEEVGDTVPLGVVWVRDVSANAPALAAEDQGGAAISDNSANYLNTSDTRLQVTLSAVDDNTYWGSETDLIDRKTGYRYLGGVIVLTCSVAQPVGNADHIFTTSTQNYYVFVGHSFVDDTSVPDDDIHYFDIVFTNTLLADSTVVLDAYGCTRFGTMATGVFASKLNPTAITTKIA